MVYNTTAIIEQENVFLVMKAIDDAANNLISVSMTLGLCIILLVVLIQRGSPAPESFFAASLTSTIVSLGLWGAGWLPLFWVIGWGMLFAFSAVALYMEKKG